ncbi:MAG: hypothetical protein JKY50_00015 [Oleispira sp.]|nr:hypothetical protein [Oleispira sp.]
MKRFVTYETYCGETVALTEDEFSLIPNLDDHAHPKEIADWVWQWAKGKEQAIKQHVTKVDEWQANPNKETY